MKYCAICGEAFEPEKLSLYKCRSCKGQVYSSMGDKTRYCASCGKLFTVNEEGAGKFYCSPKKPVYINGRRVNVCRLSPIGEHGDN